MSEHVQVTHFVDPGCPWDYSAEPVRVALERRYGEQLVWRNVQVGLYESAATAAARGYTTAGQAESYRIFSERHGMPFCTDERSRLPGSWPAARAVKAAERQSPALGAALLRRLRLAWFVEGRILDQRDELLLVAAQVAGLDLAAFTADLTADVSALALQQDMAEARRPGPVALGLEKTSQPAGEPAPRYSTPTKLTAEPDRSQMYARAAHAAQPVITNGPRTTARPRAAESKCSLRGSKVVMIDPKPASEAD